MQNKLTLQSRISSAEEQELQDHIDQRIRNIKQLKKDMEARRSQLRKIQERQQMNGLRTAEKEVTEELIQEKLDLYRKQIKRLEKEVIDLEKEKPKVNKASRQQGSLNLGT